MRPVKFQAYVKRHSVGGFMGIGAPGVDEREDMIDVESILFSNDEIDLVTDRDLNEYSFEDGSLKAVREYTGLKDKNGVEIYEGDIIRIVVPDQHSVVKGNGFDEVSFDKGFTSEGAVQFLHSMWFIDQGDGKGLPLDFDDTQIIKVIGNIYENPELLPNKK